MLEKQLLLSVRYCFYVYVFVLSRSVRWIRVNTLRRPTVETNSFSRTSISRRSFPGNRRACPMTTARSSRHQYSTRIGPENRKRSGLHPSMYVARSDRARRHLAPYVSERSSVYVQRSVSLYYWQGVGGDGMVMDVCGTCSECFGLFVTHPFPIFFLAELDRPFPFLDFRVPNTGISSSAPSPPCID